MDPIIVGVFLFVYVGMIVGGIPRLKLDRAGFALLGATVLMVSGRVSLTTAASAIHWPTLGLLIGLMIVSAVVMFGGYLTALVRRLGAGGPGEGALLGLTVASAGGLSAILSNNLICVAMAPALIEACTRRRLDPIPYLLGLACAANVGSAATLIGSPQNVLIWQTLELSFTRYLVDGGIPAVLGLGVVWVVIWLSYRNRWKRETAPSDVKAPAPGRRPMPRAVLGLIDWRLLGLFLGLAIVNKALAQSGLMSGILMMSRSAGADLTNLPTLFGVTAVLSHLASGVPAVMLLLPAARDETAGAVLALTSTLAGNWAMTGSVATISVVDHAGRLGVAIKARTFARIGVPVTLVTVALAGAWLSLRAG